LAATIQGWIVLKVDAPWVAFLAYVGAAGAFPFLALNGGRGDVVEGLSGVIGGLLYIVINGLVYWTAALCLKRAWSALSQKLSTSE
jgi:hypothetical protein